MSLEPAASKLAVEVAAMTEAGKKIDEGTMLSPVLFSIAISLKRIADKLERFT